MNHYWIGRSFCRVFFALPEKISGQWKKGIQYIVSIYNIIYDICNNYIKLD